MGLEWSIILTLVGRLTFSGRLVNNLKNVKKKRKMPIFPHSPVGNYFHFNKFYFRIYAGIYIATSSLYYRLDI